MGCSGSKSKSKTKKAELTDKEIEFLIANTSYDRDKIQELYKGFIDECPDGKLRKNFLQNTYKELYPNGNPIEFSNYLFDSLDDAKKGFISFRQFVFALDHFESDLNKQFKLMFRVYDIKRKKQVGFDEMTKLIKAVDDLKGLKPEERVGDNSAESKAKEVFKRCGNDHKNKKSALTEEQFINACLEDKFIFNTLLPAN